VPSFLSPRDIARAVGVSESSVKRWVDLGRIRAHRTAGGHRRVALGEAVQFVREAGLPLVRPEMLGLAGLTPSSGIAIPADQRTEQLLALLRKGASAEARGLILSWFLDGVAIAEIADGPLRSALEVLGELWRHGDEGILIEHRATDACLQAVHQLRLLESPGPGAPLAVGGSTDVYLLGTQVAAAVLAEEGWESLNLGAQTPPRVLERAVEELRPRLAWLSVTDMETAPSLGGDGLGRLLRTLERTGGILIVVGRARHRAGLPQHPRLYQGDIMADLAVFARGLWRAES